MYYEHFRLAGEPFSLTPDPAFLFLGDKHREAMAAVQYGLLNGRGFISLIGEVGTGKTTILYSVLGQLGAEVATAYIPYAAHSFDDLLAVALNDLGEQALRGAPRLELLETLQRMLVRRDAAGQRTALVIDEAQSLSDATFEELRLLSNFETYTHKLLQIVLVGQPELHDRLQQQNLRQLQQRVSVRAVINPLDAAEMRAYIAHRLKQVGGDERVFEAAALRAIVQHTQGIPRRANILCHNALLFAFGRSLPVVTAAAAREAIAEMDGRSPGLLGRGTLQRVPVRGGWFRRARHLAAAAGGLALVAGGVLLAGSPSQGPVTPGGAGAAATPVASPALPATADAPAPSQVESPAPSHGGSPAASPDGPVETARAERRPADAERDDAPPAAAPAPAGAQAGGAPPETEAVRTVSIAHGSSILGAARALYGRVPSEAERRALLREVLRLNPGLHDVNQVQAGAAVKFPGVPRQSENPE